MNGSRRQRTGRAGDGLGPLRSRQADLRCSRWCWSRPICASLRALLLVVLLSLAAATSASAAITIGLPEKPLPGGESLKECAAGTLLQTGASEGLSYTVPTAGTIVSWWAGVGEKVRSGLALKVARAVRASTYTIVGEAPSGTQTPETFDEYPAHIAVEQGDVIGFSGGEGECAYLTEEPGFTYAATESEQPLGSTATFTPFTGAVLALSATLVSAPSASTGEASLVEAGGAKVNGLATSEEAGTAYFQYGTSTEYGAATLPQPVGKGSTGIPVSSQLSALMPSTTYHFRVVVESAGGVSYGADHTFLTLEAPATSPARPPIAKNTLVNEKTGEITAEYEFPEAGEARARARVLNGASLASLQAARGFAASSAPLATNARYQRRGGTCEHGYVRKRKRCVSNAPVAYGQTALAAPGAGTYKLRIKPGARALRALRRGRTLNVRLTLVFSPFGTADQIEIARSVAASLKLKKRTDHGSAVTKPSGTSSAPRFADRVSYIAILPSLGGPTNEEEENAKHDGEGAPAREAQRQAEIREAREREERALREGNEREAKQLAESREALERSTQEYERVEREAESKHHKHKRKTRRHKSGAASTRIVSTRAAEDGRCWGRLQGRSGCQRGSARGSRSRWGVFCVSAGRDRQRHRIRGGRAANRTMRKLVLLLIVLVAPTSALAHARATPHDRATTLAYLHTVYAYEQSLASSASSSKAAVERLAGRLGSECPGVLAGAPRESRGFEEEQLTARERGEAGRRERQRRELNEETRAGVPGGAGRTGPRTRTRGRPYARIVAVDAHEPHTLYTRARHGARMGGAEQHAGRLCGSAGVGGKRLPTSLPSDQVAGA